MAVDDNAKRIEEAKKLTADQPAKAEQIYKDILSKPPGTNDRAVRDFENALIGLGELYRDHKRTNDLAELITQTRDVLTSFARAKTAKLGMSCHNYLRMPGVKVTDRVTCSPPTPRPFHFHSKHS